MYVCVVTLVTVAALAGVGRQLIVSKDGLGAYRSVQAALNEAVSGDTIWVNPGIYEEQVEFKNGVTVIGSGADHTIIRYGYGFDEVFHAQNIVSGRVEAITLERMPSVLDAAVVVLESAALTFADCVISGGQQAGVQVHGLSAQPVLKDCTIVGNGIHGIVCEAGAVVRIDGGTIAHNDGAGIHVSDSVLIATGTRLEANGVSGIVMDGTSSATCVSSAFVGHAGGGVDVHGSATVELTDCRFADNADGAIRLDGTAAATARESRFDGGATGILVEEEASMTLRGGTVCGASEAGIRVLDSAACSLEGVEVIECIGHGVELSSNGSCSIRFATICRNSGDGVVAAGTTVAVTESIVALNGGAGLHVIQDLALSDPPTLGYNAVWGNAGGDYVGTTRRSSDVGAYPEFVDPGSADYSLRVDSPCAGAGEYGSTIGSAVNPALDAGSVAEVTIRHDDRLLRFDVAGAVRMTNRAPFLDQIRLRAGRRWEAASIATEASFLGSGSGWLRAGGEIRLVDAAFRSRSNSAVTVWAAFGADGVLDGEGSRSSTWAGGEIMSSGTALRAEWEWERPSDITRQQLELRLGGLSIAARATELTLNELDASAATAWTREAGDLTAVIGLTMLPETIASLEAEWRTKRRILEGRVDVYVENLSTGGVSLAWTDVARASRIDLVAAIDDLQLEDLSIRAGFSVSDVQIGSEIGVNAALGIRFRLAVAIETARWFLPDLNLPPVPAFTHGPFEPEAGEPVVFDASETADSDGAAVEFWWDFGDGSVDIGNPIPHTYMEAGTYEVALTVADNDGDTATLVQSVVIFAADTTPTASFTWSPISEAGTSLSRPLRAGDHIRLDAGSSFDPDGMIVEYAWDLESDGLFDMLTEEAFISADPLDAGTWPITLRVTDDTGRADAVMRVLLLDDPKPPTAAFDASPVEPSVFDSVRFVDRSIGADGSILSWEWAFGDGHTSRDREPIHRFEQAGRYEVHLTVIDSLGLKATHSRILDVQLLPEVVPVSTVWALVIGISDYQEVEDLPYAKRDAEAVVGWLLESGVPAEHVRLMTGSPTEVGEQMGVGVGAATLLNVREGLGWLRQVASSDDLVLIHFSGHGYQGPDDGSDEADLVDEFFVLSDTRAAAKDDTALRDDEFGRFLDRIASDHVLVFFDSCYSGGLSRSLTPGRRSSGDNQDWFGDLRLEGRLVLAASSEGEEAFESPQLEHGVFTHFLLEGLGGEADLNADYHITVWELYEYVAARVPGFVDMERGEPQHPQLLGEGETRIVLSYRKRPLEAALSYCPAVPYAGGTIVFSDESSSATIAERTWAFGDGTSGTGEQIEHVFSEDATYDVTLRVRNEAGDSSETRIQVRVDPPGRVDGIDPLSGHAVITLGVRNGLRTGDRFAVDRGVGIDAMPHQSVLEVIELVGEDRAACRILDGADESLLDGTLVPISADPCSPTR